MADTADLRKIAEAATPGPWRAKCAECFSDPCRCNDPPDEFFAYDEEDERVYERGWWIPETSDLGNNVCGAEREGTARHIAAWHPGRARAALKVIEAAESVATALPGTG